MLLEICCRKWHNRDSNVKITAFHDMTPCSLVHNYYISGLRAASAFTERSTLTVGLACSSKTSVAIYQTTRHYNRKERNLTFTILRM